MARKKPDAMGYEMFIEAIREAAERYATVEDDGAMTLNEWASALKWSKNKTRRVFLQMKVDNKLEVCRVMRKNLDDCMRSASAYRMVTDG